MLIDDHINLQGSSPLAFQDAGDFGTILFFQLSKIPFPILGIMTLAIINGLITSIILETIILMKQNFSQYGFRYKCY